MTERTDLARISAASFGAGGYQDAQFGLHLTFSGKGWGVGTSEAYWTMEPSPNAQWTAADQQEFFGKLCLRIAKVLAEAGKKDVAGLVGVPVEVTLDGNALKSWRVLTEVLP